MMTLQHDKYLSQSPSEQKILSVKAKKKNNNKKWRSAYRKWLTADSR